MHTKTTIMLAIASLLAANAGAMAATTHRNHERVMQSEAVLNARAQAPRYGFDSSTYNYEEGYSAPATLFDRAKGNIE